MGRNSNFPGKPSKLVTKKRVSVLIGNHINNNSGIIGVSTASNGIGAQTNTNNDPNNAHLNDVSVKSSNNNSELDSDIAIRSNATNSAKCDVVQASSPKESHLDEESGSSCQDDAPAKKPTKKKVSFKFGLETSDDAHIVKKEPNSIFTPPVSIIKKECLTRAIRIARGGESIIKPSVLSGLKILNNGANIDKLNSLTFKSQTSKFSSCKLSDAQSEESAEDQSDVDGDEGREKNGHSSSDEGSDETNSQVKNDNDSDLTHGVPERSVHSSRVIKPNKRFCDESKSSLSKNGMGRKKSSKIEVEALNQSEIQKHEDERNVLKVSEHIKNNPFARIGDDIFGSSKSLLRQSKLQFASSTLSSTTSSTNKDNLFSTNATNASLNRNSIQLCCICGTAAQAAFTHKSRKYGSCCDSCNKYISKTVKKCFAKVDQLPPKTLQCKKGDGNCLIVPIVPNIHHSFKAKKPCSACWLKKCIQSCRLTSEDRGRVLKLLPICMRSIESKSFTSPFQSKLETITDSTPSISTGLTNLFGNSLASAKRLLSPWTTAKDGSETTEFRSFTSLSNPLSENNSKFGSSPKILPNILEKSAIMTSGISASLPITVTSNKKSQEIDEHVKESVKELVNESVKESVKETSTQDYDLTTVTRKALPEAAEMNAEQEETSRLRLRKKDKLENVATACIATTTSLTATITASSGGDTTKRQRIDLKGPRVKHVCRSASIVLGQPIATFGDENQILETLDTPPRPESPNGIVEFEGPIPSIAPNTECSDSTRLSPPATPIINDYDSESALKDQSGAKSPGENSKSDDSSSASVDCIRRSDNDTKPVTRKLTRPNNVTTNGAPSVNNKKLNSFIRKPALKAVVKTSPSISIDFWENYDPAEVSQRGFGLIFSEEIDIKALCFLCGSCGQDPLMFCVCCCEPYHEYCVEDKYNLKPHNSHDDTNASFMETSFLSGIGTLSSPANKLNWLCPRCTTCYSCNMASGSKVKCQKCQKNYHPTCLGTSKRSSGADRPLICASCLKCKSCGTTKVSKFIGNMPMCTKCFESRQNGKYCPMCNKCYEENDFNIKMMECGDCKKWVHAKCEGLSDEKYNMLSVLPENIEFICRICRGKKNLNEFSLNVTNSMDINNSIQQITWEAAVTAELKNGLLSVVKQLSKSRQACALLKLSPRKKPSTCGYCTQNQSRVKHNENDFEDYIEDPFDFASSQANESDSSSFSNRCYCVKTSASSKPNTSQSLIDIKQKIIANETYSLADFNYDMNLIIGAAACDELMTAYKEILSEAFPWFQNETKACTDALEEDMYDSCNFDQTSMETNEVDQQVPMIDIPDDIDEYFYQPVPCNDTRICVFCKSCGDGYPAQESRLLYCGQNSWVHANCAMWSAEVFEEIDGSLQNVHSAISRGRMIKCSECGNKGATVGCNLRNCGEHYHFPCARRANCAFMSDKTVFCPQHSNNENRNSNAIQETNFEVLRPVYIELDRKRKRPVNPKKVQFLIGSLHVKQLGRFVPKLSDLPDAIVPAEFLCSRLYWSSKEPWKIVEYTIRTTVLSNFNIAMDMGRNFTVDHSSTLSKVQIGLAQITKWHSTLLNGDAHENVSRLERNAKLVNGHGEETNEEEPQTNADLLPPEIKDAIFEDLPHDILDGISMLDILPKLMYEDMMAMDTKNESSLNADSLRDNETDDEMSQGSQKGFDNDNWTSTNMHAEDAMLSARSAAGALSRDVKRSKSHQRTAAWSNKIDSALSAKRSRLTMLMSFRKTNEERSNISEIKRQCKRSSEEIKDKSFTWSAAKRFTQLNNDIHTTDNDAAKNRFKISQLDGMDDFDTDSRAQKSLLKCDRCNYTFRNQESFQRHLQSCEKQSSIRDSNSKTPDVQQQSIQSNVILTSVNGQDYCNLPILQQNNHGHQIFGIGGTNINQLAMQNSVQVNGQTLPLASIQNGSLPVQMQSMFINPNTGSIQSQQSHVFGQPLTLGALQQQVFPIQNLAQNAGNQAQTLSLQHATSQNIQYQPQIITCSSANTSQVLTVTPSQQQNIATSNYASIKTIQTQPTHLNRNTIILPQTDKSSPTKKQPIAKLQLSPGRTKGRITTNVTPKTIQIKKSNQVIKTENSKTMAQITNTSVTNIRPNGATHLDNNNLVIQSTSTPTSNQPIIVQQVASSNQGNLLQYVTSDGSNNGLQYFTMATNDFKPQQPTQYLTPNPLIPGTFQLQSDNGNILLANTATGLQVIPNNAFSQQPQVIGTIIQPHATTIQCGMMSSEQMVLGGTPSFDITNSLNGCMLLNSQPVYYGLETIVQNTVMQSQQFVSTAMQGVLSQNSSFSATTTQVFQASKIEPIMDMQQSYVVLNNDGTIMASQPQQPILATTNLLQQAIPQLQNQTSQIQSAQNAGWRIIDDKSNVFTTNPNIIQTQPQTTTPQSHSNTISVQPQTQQQNQIQSIPAVSPQVQLQKVQPHKQITKSRQLKQPVTSKQTAKPLVKSSPIIVNEMQSQVLKSDIDLKPQIVLLKSTDAFNIQKPPEISLKNDGNKKLHLSNTSSHEMKISAKIHPPTSQYVNQRKFSTATPVVNGTKISPVSVKPKIVEKGVHGENPFAKQSNIHISIQKAITSNPTSKTKVTTTEGPKLGIIEQPIVKTIQNESEILLSPATPITILPNSNGPINIAMTGSANTKSNTSEIPEFESPNVSQNKCETIARPAIKLSMKPSVLDTSPEVSVSSSVTNTFNSQSITTQNSNLANQVQINFPISNCIQLPTAPYANGIPTNVVNPIQHIHSGNRPMNRVLPMQTIQPKCSPTGIDSSESKSTVNIKSNLVKCLNDEQKSPMDSSFSSTSSLSSTPKLKIEENPGMDEEMNIDEADDFVNRNIAEERENTELRSEEIGADISAAKDIDDSSNSTDFDSFKDSFLRGSSTEEVFDKLKKEEQINNSKSRTEEKICESTMNNGKEPESDCKMDPEDQHLFDIPDSSEDTRTIVTNVMPNEADEAENVQTNEISNQKENIVPSIPTTAISSSVKLKTQKSSKEFAATKATGPRLLYEIQSEDGFTYKSTSISEIWEKLFEAVQIARKAHGLSHLPVGPLADMCGYQMMGLKTNALKYLLEQLPGVERCSNYLPVYHKRAESTISHTSSSGYWSDCDEILKENVNGTARCERYKGRSEYDMFGWLASRHRKQPVQICVPQHGIETETLIRRGSGSNLPMAMRYRTLKETYKDSVGVYRSHIHGRGLFCNRDIEAGEMVIEYAGELIRSTLTDKRERYYDSRGIGCYMFKIDDNLVVDATMRGNAARFINHSCEPNCYSKVVDILGHKHIIIFALRRIVQGEELTYDYKFPFEETKIPCSCGSRKCRKYLN